MTIERIEGFEVLDVLGHGASSTIYAVQDLDTGQVYALKQVPRRNESDQRYIEQALTEHEVTSQLDHPVLRKSYRLIRRRKMFRLVELLVLMEMVEGVTLEEHRPSGLRRMMLAFLAVSEGLEAMHRQGFLHCDIKPNNILVTKSGRVKIIDFGHACPVNTVKQRIQGTPDYISPEQVLRHPLTPRSDIFNLGATMYWCFTNHKVPTLIPTDDEQVAVRAEAQIKPVSRLNPSVPPSLGALVMHCLRHDPKERPASMKEVRDRLAVALKQMSEAGKQTRAG